MKKIVYISFASDTFKDSDIKDILETAHSHNPSVGITGMLLYKSGTFLQLLEGPKQNVEDLYQKIANDSRHRSVYIIADTELSTRLFPDWSMAFDTLEDMDLKTLNTVLELGEYKDPKKRPVQDNRFIVEILDKFRERLPASQASEEASEEAS